ncbi:hypothetical protein [Tenacibaculum sp. C7A-26P2]|uniref:hypothetical protein n=1 Tax=Tenacibaculum sp. C7A-26P2 TaxID=3447504 RepID=UPI003F84E544
MTENLLDIVYVDTSDFACANGYDPCGHKERTLSYALYVDIPEQLETPDEIFKECCYYHKVLASLTDNESYKNDYSSFYHKRQIPSETCDFIMIDMSDDTEYPLDDNTYGELKNFNTITDIPDLKIFKIEWKKVLEDLGTGSYKIVKRCNLVGISIDIEYLVYNLQNYSTSVANGTTRIDVAMNGYLENLGITFEGSGFETTLRIPGFFGRRNPKLEEDNIVNRNYVKRQISIKQTNEYKFQTNMIPDCLTNEIFDFLLLADDIKINDYNLNNHSYSYKYFPVSIGEIQEPVYGSHTRKAQVNLTFTDKIVNKIHRI